MNKEKADEIMKKIQNHWNRTAPPNVKVSEEQLLMIRVMLNSCPDEDGLKRVTSMETGKTHLVPYEDIILFGLRGDNLDKYPIEKK
jgi:hypothetical protein